MGGGWLGSVLGPFFFFPEEKKVKQLWREILNRQEVLPVTPHRFSSWKEEKPFSSTRITLSCCAEERGGGARTL